MKKLLVFMLVLGMCSVTQAALTFNIHGTDPNCTIDGLIEYTQTVYFWIGSDAAITLSAGAAAPDMAGSSGTLAYFRGYGVPIPTTYTYGEAWVMASSGDPYVSGTYLIGEGASGDSVGGGWFDEAGGYGLYGSGTLVPEPMTIALLGLGGLFLRRRK